MPQAESHVNGRDVDTGSFLYVAPVLALGSVMWPSEEMVAPRGASIEPVLPYQ